MSLLIVAGRTAPNRSVRFGGEHDPLDERGRADVRALSAQLPPGIALVSGPELSVRHSAQALGAPFDVLAGLSTLDVGNWMGVRPEDLAPAELGGWLRDPDSRPHGGESVTDFVGRITACVRSIDDAVALVVSKPAAQALLCPDPMQFFATQLRPASLHRRPA